MSADYGSTYQNYHSQSLVLFNCLMALGTNEFLYEFFLASGALHLLPDGSLLKYSFSGCESSLMTDDDFLINDLLYVSSTVSKFLPTSFDTCLVILSNFCMLYLFRFPNQVTELCVITLLTNEVLTSSSTSALTLNDFSFLNRQDNVPKGTGPMK